MIYAICSLIRRNTGPRKLYTNYKTKSAENLKKGAEKLIQNVLQAERHTNGHLKLNSIFAFKTAG